MTTIEIFEKRVKVELTDVVYREFGEDFVKFYDTESGKYFEVVVREVKKDSKQVEKSILKPLETIKSNKLTKDSPEYKKWLKKKK